jgi:hypothetical protein
VSGRASEPGQASRGEKQIWELDSERRVNEGAKECGPEGERKAMRKDGWREGGKKRGSKSKHSSEKHTSASSVECVFG